MFACCRDGGRDGGRWRRRSNLLEREVGGRGVWTYVDDEEAADVVLALLLVHRRLIDGGRGRASSSPSILAERGHAAAAVTSSGLSARRSGVRGWHLQVLLLSLLLLLPCRKRSVCPHARKGMLKSSHCCWCWLRREGRREKAKRKLQKAAGGCQGRLRNALPILTRRGKCH